MPEVFIMGMVGDDHHGKHMIYMVQRGIIFMVPVYGGTFDHPEDPPNSFRPHGFPRQTIPPCINISPVFCGKQVGCVVHEPVTSPGSSSFQRLTSIMAGNTSNGPTVDFERGFFAASVILFLSPPSDIIV
jgi:hypothetical protein